MDGAKNQDDHDGDEQLEVVVRENGLDVFVDSCTDCDLFGFSEGNLDTRFELWKQVCELLLGVRLKVEGIP